jgi:hypothetical protein
LIGVAGSDKPPAVQAGNQTKIPAIMTNKNILPFIAFLLVMNGSLTAILISLCLLSIPPKTRLFFAESLISDSHHQ